MSNAELRDYVGREEVFIIRNDELTATGMQFWTIPPGMPTTRSFCVAGGEILNKDGKDTLRIDDLVFADVDLSPESEGGKITRIYDLCYNHRGGVKYARTMNLGVLSKEQMKLIADFIEHFGLSAAESVCEDVQEIARRVYLRKIGVDQSTPELS